MVLISSIKYENISGAICSRKLNLNLIQKMIKHFPWQSQSEKFSMYCIDLNFSRYNGVRLFGWNSF